MQIEHKSMDSMRLILYRHILKYAKDNHLMSVYGGGVIYYVT